MKNLIYILLFALISAMTITACTEEEIAPSADCNDNGGGGVSNDRIY